MLIDSVLPAPPLLRTSCATDADAKPIQMKGAEEFGEAFPRERVGHGAFVDSSG
jgi:hypothetical protein